MARTLDVLDTSDPMPSLPLGPPALVLACITGLQAQAPPPSGSLPFRIPDRVAGYHLAARPASAAPVDHLSLNYQTSHAEPVVTVGVYPLGQPAPCPVPCDSAGLLALVTAFRNQLGPARAAGGWTQLDALDLSPFRAPFEEPLWPAWHLVVIGVQGPVTRTLHYYWVATPVALVTARTVLAADHRWEDGLDRFVSRYAEEVVHRLPSRARTSN